MSEKSPLIFICECGNKTWFVRNDAHIQCPECEKVASLIIVGMDNGFNIPVDETKVN